MSYSDFIIYADESGDHNIANLDSNYPVFVLNCCVFRKADYAASALPEMAAFKFAHFGHDDVVLHENDIRRKAPPFAFLRDEQRRNTFMDGLDRLIAAADFTIIAAVVDKSRLANQNAGSSIAKNPYELALSSCLEQAYRFLTSKGQQEQVTHIVIEKRNGQLDRELERGFKAIRDGDNALGKPFNFEIVFADKKSNSAGLQIADLTARPVGLRYINPNQDNRAWNKTKGKLFHYPPSVATERGFTVLPG